MEYDVQIKVTEVYLVRIDQATSEADAMNKANIIFDNCENKDIYHDDSEHETEAFGL